MTWVDLVPFRTPLMVSDRTIEPITWLKWLTRLVAAVNRTPQTAGSVALATQGASITTTPVPLTFALPTGLARLTYAMRVTRAAGTSSGFQLTLGWVDGGVAQTQTFANETGNTTTTTQGAVYPFHVDGGTVPTYAVSYASVGAPTMQFALTLAVEVVP